MNSTSVYAKVIIGLKECMGLNENHSHPIIRNNTAYENGGGFWINGVNEENMTMEMYCGIIEKNLAILEPGSANIYQTGGLATVYAGTVGEGVIVIGGKYDYVPDNDIPEVYITYNSNIPDNIETKKAQVTVGVEIYLPKTLFSRDGYALLGWSYVQSPTENDTIFEAGGPYLVPNEDITVYAVWGIIGVGEIEVPVIKAGKYYDEITGSSNIMITNDAEFTAQMVVNQIKPNLYTNRKISFDKNLCLETTILMIDMTDISNRKYYFYKVKNSEVKEINLSDFTEVTGKEKYVDSITEEEVNESYIFVVDLPNDNSTIGPNQMKLTRYTTQADVADIEQIVSFTTTEKRDFILKNKTDENACLNDAIKLSYIKENPAGNDTKYLNRNMSIIISDLDEMLLEETQIYDGTNYYTMNSDKKFIIPLGEVTEDIEQNLYLVSDVIAKNEQSCNLKAELWISGNEDSENPFMGEMVAEIENISLAAVELPAVKIEMNQRIYKMNEFDGNLKLKYNTKIIDNCSTTLEVQKKNEVGEYETLSDILTSVDSIQENQNGIFNFELLDSGTINLEIDNSQNAEIGTYRILMKVTKNNEEILEVPYNFIILE